MGSYSLSRLCFIASSFDKLIKICLKTVIVGMSFLTDSNIMYDSLLLLVTLKYKSGNRQQPQHILNKEENVPMKIRLAVSCLFFEYSTYLYF